jgi:hypothetical protein
MYPAELIRRNIGQPGLQIVGGDVGAARCRNPRQQGEREDERSETDDRSTAHEEASQVL